MQLHKLRAFAMAQEFKSLITIGPRVRKSPFFDATKRYGVNSFTIYGPISCRRVINPNDECPVSHVSLPCSLSGLDGLRCRKSN
jgi:hypothetical protein